ncbi:MAG: hypothetical protein MJ060_04085 [Clostridia bacterium]|nr:hypothetical protein [Clostridia bacterium]
MIIVLLPEIGLMDIMLQSQFIGGLILPVLLVFMALIASDKRIMKKYAVGKITKFFLWLTVIVVTALTVSLLIINFLA